MNECNILIRLFFFLQQNEDASDPAQIILLTLAIFYVEEVSFSD